MNEEMLQQAVFLSEEAVLACWFSAGVLVCSLIIDDNGKNCNVNYLVSLTDRRR